MYDNIGGKLKGLAKIAFIIESIAGFFWGIALSVEDDDMIPLGIALVILVPVVAYAMSLVLYGFGELIDKTCDIERNTRGRARKSETQDKVDSERIRKIEKLRSQGLISEDEYQKVMSKVQ